MRGKKTKLLANIIIIMSIGIGFYLQYGRSMDVYNSFSMSATNFHEERITVVANKLYIWDKERCAKEIFKRCRKNDFKSIRFSYDYAKPNALYVSVYLSEHSVKSGTPFFEFSYTQEDTINGTYNILDHPQYFHLKIGS